MKGAVSRTSYSRSTRALSLFIAILGHKNIAQILHNPWNIGELEVVPPLLFLTFFPSLFFNAFDLNNWYVSVIGDIRTKFCFLKVSIAIFFLSGHTITSGTKFEIESYIDVRNISRSISTISFECWY